MNEQTPYPQAQRWWDKVELRTQMGARWVIEGGKGTPPEPEYAYFDGNIIEGFGD